MTSTRKNIVICSDGTGNTTVKGRGTNVFKLFEAVDLHDQRRTPAQVAFYDDGVGTENVKLLKMFSGITGFGLGRNLRGLYSELVRTYNPGDRIYLFGFSRGAYTVRTLVGLIASCGIIDRSKIRSDHHLKSEVKTAYRLYRMKYACLHTRLSRLFKQHETLESFRVRLAISDDEHAKGGRIPIEFIGVWDTVAAVGLPFQELRAALDAIYRLTFNDWQLYSGVNKACHAVSIDDERRTFHPIMWENCPDRPDRIQQVWFAGVHSDVGGGYPRHGLSLTALDWMMEEAEQSGLRFHPNERNLYRKRANSYDKMHDPRAGLGVYYRYLPRDIQAICRDHAIEPAIHVSVLERIAQGAQAYSPASTPVSRIVSRPNEPCVVEPDIQQLHQAVNEELRNKDVQTLMTRGASLHYYFIGLTLLAVGVGMMTWWVGALFLYISAGLLGLLCFAFYKIGQRTRIELHQRCSEAWTPRRDELKALLAGNGGGEA